MNERLMRLFEEQSRKQQQCNPPVSRSQAPPHVQPAPPPSAPSGNRPAVADPAVNDWSQIDILTLSIDNVEKTFRRGERRRCGGR